jgi:hypothetical protein
MAADAMRLVGFLGWEPDAAKKVLALRNDLKVSWIDAGMIPTQMVYL